MRLLMSITAPKIAGKVKITLENLKKIVAVFERQRVFIQGFVNIYILRKP